MNFGGIVRYVLCIGKGKFMRSAIIATFLLVCSTAVAQPPQPIGPQSPKYQGVAEKQPIDHPVRGSEASAIPDALRPNGKRVLIPELTEIKIALRDDMKSGFTRPGSEVLFLVAEDVYAPGPTLVLTKGTPVIGHVVKSEGHQSFGRSGQLFLTCDYVLAQDRTRIPLRAVEKQARGRSASDQSWIATLKGAVVGAELASSADSVVRSWWPIAFVGPLVSALIEGKNVNLHPGQLFIVHTERDVAVMSPQPLEIAPIPREIDPSIKYQALDHYPTVHMKSGESIIGVPRNDPTGKWATIYGPLRVTYRVLISDIAFVD